ncbi:hypothetical protein [Streptomyces rugosispiralis]|uniref:Secreted protein n=1 Tax=Streptomyces rugosispiralis TaxID=2967341 RepID=A0ABT1UQ40_9ACTN|nr:hypothetical protein [Streptomyces rugosispiralis]MCQ8187249.1 hypothetical protein [Streptomyces rugosispiralis]
MQIAKKAALLAATAGAFALLGTGTAAADGYGSDVPTSFKLSSVIFQDNHCNTSTGTTSSIGGVGPSGDMTIGSNCVNFIGG